MADSKQIKAIKEWRVINSNPLHNTLVALNNLETEVKKLKEIKVA